MRNCAKPTKHDLPKCVRWFLFINSSSCYFGPDVRTATAFCCTTNQLLDLTEPANVAAARQGVQKPEVRTREGEDSSWSWPQTSSSKQATMCITVGFFFVFYSAPGFTAGRSLCKTCVCACHSISFICHLSKVRKFVRKQSKTQSQVM